MSFVICDLFSSHCDATEKEFGLKFYKGNNVYFCLKRVKEEMGQSTRDYRSESKDPVMKNATVAGKTGVEP